MPTTTQDLSMGTAGSSAPLLHEILVKVNNAKDKAKKIDVLREHDSVPLRQVLKGAFDPKIKWDLPEGTPYTKRMTHQQVLNIQRYTKKLEDYGTLLKVQIKNFQNLKKK